MTRKPQPGEITPTDETMGRSERSFMPALLGVPDGIPRPRIDCDWCGSSVLYDVARFDVEGIPICPACYRDGLPA